MVATEEHATSGASDCHVTICDECPSQTGEGVVTRQCDSGHERLLDRMHSNDGKGIAHCRASRPPNYLYFAVLVSFFNCPFGCLAVVFSLMSRKSLNDGNFEDATTRGLIAKWLSIAGVAIAIVGTAFLIVYFVYIDNNIVDTEKELRGY